MTKSLNSLNVELSPNESAILALAINHFGGTDHPYADDKTIPYFAPAYALACAGSATDSGKLTDDGVTLLGTICKRIRDASRR